MHPATALAALLCAALASVPSRALSDAPQAQLDWQMTSPEIYVARTQPQAEYELVHGPRVDHGIPRFDRPTRLWLTPPIRDRCRVRLAAAPLP